VLKRPGAVLLRLVVGLSVGIAILSGCSGKQEASTSLPAPTSKAAPTTATLPPLGPPDFPVPAAARTKDAAGAEAFTRYWIDLVNRQRAIPAGQPLRELGPHCSDCLRIARNYDTVAAAGHRYQGGELKFNDLPPAELQGEKAIVNFAVRRDAVRILDSSGRVVDAGAPFAPNEIGGGILQWSPDLHAWLMQGFQIG
jgi:hypothetical protein